MAVELLDVFGDDLTVVNAARVSLAKESTEFSPQDAKLISYLANHSHISPFFHPQARFRLKMPIFIAREWFRHTIGFARNEVSRRYVDTPPDFFFPTELRPRAPLKKQGSLEDVPFEKNEECMKILLDHTDSCASVYRHLLDQGVCPEQARLVLPQNMMTEFIETGSLAAYARLCNLRLHPDSQKEIRELAAEIARQLEAKFPVSWRALLAASQGEQ